MVVDSVVWGEGDGGDDVRGVRNKSWEPFRDRREWTADSLRIED